MTLLKHRMWYAVLAVAALGLMMASCAPAATPTTAPPPAATQPPAAQPTAAPTRPAAAPTTPPAASARGTCGTLKLLWWQAPTILNPHLAQGTKDYDASRLVYEPLAAINDKGEPDARYGLAAEVPTRANGGISADGTSITWKLKKDVKWSDGAPFNADDVVFTFQFVTDKATASTNAQTFANVKSVDKVDDLTVKVTFKEAEANPYSAFTSGLGMIISKKQFADFMGAKAKDAPANLKPVGTGPFKVVDFKPGDVVVYTINETYRDPNAPCFKDVNMKGGGDATSAARASIQTGDVDYAWNLQVAADVLLDLTKAAGAKGELVTAPSSNVERLLVNFSNPAASLGDKRGERDQPHPFLTDKKVRQALAISIPREQIGGELYGAGMTGSATCNIVTAPPAFVSSTKFETCSMKGDLAAANKLLDEAGWVKGADGIRAKGGVKMSIVYQTTVNPVRQKTQEIVAQAWKQLGVAVELKAVQAGVFFSSDVANPDTAAKFFTDIEMFTNGMSQPDDVNYTGGWTCDEIKTKAGEWRGNNYHRWCDTTYDGLYGQMLKELDPAKRAALWKQLNDRLVEEVVVIPLVARNSPVSAKSKTLKGIVANPWDSELWNVSAWTNK